MVITSRKHMVFKYYDQKNNYGAHRWGQPTICWAPFQMLTETSRSKLQSGGPIKKLQNNLRNEVFLD